MPDKKKKKMAAKKRVRKKDPRAEIKVLALIEALERHVLGEQEMTATQVNAALALLKKTLPDMAEGAKTGKNAPALHEDALRELE